ncbi:MAG: ABC transporter permease [Planctomycetaceae bacterium]|nr:ABC transporter permease [Planctomycetaceae bacterium]
MADKTDSAVRAERTVTQEGLWASLLKVNKLVYVLVFLCLLVWLLTDIFGVGNVGNKWVFLTRRNISNVLNQVSINAVIAFGMTLVILTKGIDLSVGSVVAATGVFLSVMFVDWQMPLWQCYILTMLAGALTGVFNGALVAFFKLPPFIATLGSLTIFRGIAFLMVDGRAKFISDRSFQVVGRGFLDIGIPVPWAVVIMLLFFVAFQFLMTMTTFGRKVYFLGGNEQAATLVGIHAKVMRLVIFSIMVFITGFGGIMVASRLGSGSPNIGTGYEMDAIAAVVVGGTSFLGGKGTIVGTLLGAITIGIIANGMNLMGISPYFQFLAKGVIILLAVILSSDYAGFGGRRK